MYCLFLVVLRKSGSLSESVTLPDTITEWYGNAVCTNEDVGLGISEFASVTTFQTFFIQLNLPYSIIRGETVHIPVLLFNYLNNDQCLVVSDLFRAITINSRNKTNLSLYSMLLFKLSHLMYHPLLIYAIDQVLINFR